MEPQIKVILKHLFINLDFSKYKVIALHIADLVWINFYSNFTLDFVPEKERVSCS